MRRLDAGNMSTPAALRMRGGIPSSWAFATALMALAAYFYYGTYQQVGGARHLVAGTPGPNHGATSAPTSGSATTHAARRRPAAEYTVDPRLVEALAAAIQDTTNPAVSSQPVATRVQQAPDRYSLPAPELVQALAAVIDESNDDPVQRAMGVSSASSPDHDQSGDGTTPIKPLAETNVPHHLAPRAWPLHEHPSYARLSRYQRAYVPSRYASRHQRRGRPVRYRYR